MERIVVRHGGKTGASVHAARPLAAGETVLTFQGAEISSLREMHSIQIGPNEHLIVDPPWRYVNHSCAPNCGFSGSRDLVAMRPIATGEEIAFDYAMCELEVSQAHRCLCGASRCRRLITGFLGLPEPLREEYRPYLSDYLRGLTGA